MKILFVVNNVSITSIPLELAGHLAARHDVAVLSFYDKDKPPAESASHAEHLKMFYCGVRGSADVRGFLRCSRLIRKIAPDIIHTHHTYSGVVTRILAKFAGGIKVVHTVHANHRSYGRLNNIIIGLTLPLCDRIICNSQNTKRTLLGWQKALLKKKRIEVIYNGVDTKRIKGDYIVAERVFKQYALVKRAEFVIGTVGRLVWQKDHETLVKAFALFKKKVPAAKLLLVGDGVLRRRIETLSHDLGLSGDVIISGMLPRDAVYALLPMIDIFVISSVYEGFCNAMVEAMLAEVPVIATRIDPLPEVLGEDCGKYFIKRDHAALADVMAEMYGSDRMRKDYGRRAKARAKERFTITATVNGYSNVYTALLS